MANQIQSVAGDAFSLATDALLIGPRCDRSLDWQSVVD